MHRVPLCAGLVFLLALLAACGPQSATPILYPVEPGELPEEAEILAGIDQSRGFRDAFQAVREGRFVVAAAAPQMSPTERVIGLDLGTVSFCYPIQYLNSVEIVEHTAAGQELLVCW